MVKSINSFVVVIATSIISLCGCSIFPKSAHRTLAECNTRLCSSETCQVENPADYALVFADNALSECHNVHGLFGRVLRGRKKSDFNTLSDDPTRKIIFLMDAQGLQTIRGLATPDLLKQIGYTPEYIDNLIKEQYQFKLVVFKEFSDAMPATWENVLVLINQIYPPEIGKIVASQLPNLRTMNFNEIEGQAPTKFKKIHELGVTNSEYITEDKLVVSNGELWKVRAFLYHQLRLTELFSGSGYTQLSDGTGGTPEYIILNKTVDELPEVKIIDLK